MSQFALKLYGWVVLASILVVTTWASLEKGITFGIEYVLAERWGIATLFDTYFGFLFFWLWVCYKQSSWVARSAWFIAIMLFGNIAMAIYFLIQLYKVPKNQWSIEKLLLKN